MVSVIVSKGSWNKRVVVTKDQSDSMRQIYKQLGYNVYVIATNDFGKVIVR